MTAALEYWPLLLLPALLAIAPWVRRRNWVRAARHHWRAHPSIDQASHDRAEVVHPKEEQVVGFDAAEMRELANASWLETQYGRVLHHADLDDGQLLDLYGQGSTRAKFTCGPWATVFIPGLGSRLSLDRCRRCCDAFGLPHGVGSPKNDDACRVLLGLDAS